MLVTKPELANNSVQKLQAFTATPVLTDYRYLAWYTAGSSFQLSMFVNSALWEPLI